MNVRGCTTSQRGINFPDNPIRGLETIAAEVKAHGVRIISLNIGAPDTMSPPEIIQKGRDFYDLNDHVEYGPSVGDSELRQARSGFYRKRLGIDIDPEEILITSGASEALELAIFTTTDVGDEILTPEPFFPNYLSTCYKFGVALKAIPTEMTNGFHLSKTNESPQEMFNRIAVLIGPGTKAILWSSPSNPTGSVYSLEELRVLAEISKKFNLFLIADEVYRLLAYDQSARTDFQIRRAPSIYDVISGSDRDRVICLDSSSKEISFCGGRIGYLIAKKECITVVVKNASVRACVNIPAQKAVGAINAIAPTYFVKNQDELKTRRDYVYSQLSKMSNLGISISPLPPEGAFYLTFDLGEGISSEHFCKWLLTDYPVLNGSSETVFLTPMRTNNGGFYLTNNNGTGQVRLAYVRNIQELGRAMEILKSSIKLYKSIYH